MTHEETIAFFARRHEAYEELDAKALAADYSEDAVIDSPTGGTHRGREAAEAVLKRVFSAFLDMKITAEPPIVDGDTVAQVLSIEGTNVGEFMGLPPSRRPFRMPAVFVYELKNGQIVRERRIYDFMGMLVQIGVLKAKPA
jgi:steroid delta-isomerase-like uncharacterized protein